MSKSKRLEKEIDYLKFLIGGIVAIMAGVLSWIINKTIVLENVLLQLAVWLLGFVLIVTVIILHLKVQNKLEELEATND